MKTGKMFAALLTLCQVALGQCPEYDSQPPRLNVVVKTLVMQNADTKIFTYRYSIANDSLSMGCVDRFAMDLTYPPYGATLSSDGLIDYPRYVDRSALQLSSSVQIVPVGIPMLPRFRGLSSAWFAGFSVDGKVDWIRGIPAYRLPPGETIDSLTITSYGPPGIRPFTIIPSYRPVPPVIITPANEDSVYRNVPEPTQEDEDNFQRLQDSIKVRGFVIGPTAPPANFNGTTFLDTLISYKHQAFALGWIKEEGIVSSLDAKLEAARPQIINDRPSAKNILQSFVNELDALNSQGDQITSEAYALLKFNAQYLMSKL